MSMDFETWWDDPPDDGPTPVEPVSKATAQWIWDAAVAAERERWAKECACMASLSWAAADQPYASEVKMQHEAVAAAFEQMAADMRA
jgi:hypothetical protein